MTKKHKSGYAYLKEKVAELENKNATLAEHLLSAQVKSLQYEEAFKDTRARLARLNDHIDRYHWLYKHAPFWLKWWFCKHFFGK